MSILSELKWTPKKCIFLLQEELKLIVSDLTEKRNDQRTGIIQWSNGICKISCFNKKSWYKWTLDVPKDIMELLKIIVCEMVNKKPNPAHPLS